MKNSLYHEVKKLISLRKAHPALESKGKIDFICAEKNAYPLAYTREADGEKDTRSDKSLGKTRRI